MVFDRKSRFFFNLLRDVHAKLWAAEAGEG
jgi:hypothetical protein